MHRITIVTAAIFIGVLVLAGCARNWKDPATSLPTKKIKIKALLLAQIANDGAGIEVKGKVWDVSRETAVNEKGDEEVPFTVFKLADKDGNAVGVFTLGHIEILEGDLAEVKGYYRREENTKLHNFKNEIEAVTVKFSSKH